MKHHRRGKCNGARMLDLQANFLRGFYSSVFHPNNIFDEQPQFSIAQLDLETYWATVNVYQSSNPILATPGSILQHRKPGGITERLSRGWSACTTILRASRCDVCSSKGRLPCNCVAFYCSWSTNLGSRGLPTFFLIANNLQILSATTYRCRAS